MKMNSEMIAIKINGKNYYLLICGEGLSEGTPRQGAAQYSGKGMNSGYVHTNEQHLSTSKYINIIIILYIIIIIRSTK